MKRTLLKLSLLALSAFALAACETNPSKPEPVAAKPVPVAPAPTKTLVEMQYELDKLAMELELKRTMAMIKFADESKSDYAKGVVSGKLMNDSPPAAQQQRPSFVQVAQQQQQHAAEVDLRHAELAERNSWWNKGLQVTDRVLGFKMFGKNLDQERYRIDQSNSQQRFLFGTLRGTQQDAYGFSATVLEHGPYVLPAGATPAATTPAVE
jgi:hypothetical protein